MNLLTESFVLNIACTPVKTRLHGAGFFKITRSAMRLRSTVALVAIFALSGYQTQAQDTGIIRGKLDHAIARRIPAVVYIDSIAAGASTATFPPTTANPVMDQVNLTYTPHVLPVLVGSTIDFPNSDSTRHHVYTSTSSVCQFDLGIYDVGVVKQVACEKPGLITLLCNVHAEMRGFLLVAPTPYFASTDEEGGFVIEGVPEGTYRLTFEHERLQSKSLEVTVAAGRESIADFGAIERKRR
jgi:plastocyanin